MKSTKAKRLAALIGYICIQSNGAISLVLSVSVCARESKASKVSKGRVKKKKFAMHNALICWHILVQTQSEGGNKTLYTT